MEALAAIFVLIFMLSGVALVIGLIKPSLVLHSKISKTRTNVFKLYVSIIVLSFVALGFTTASQGKSAEGGIIVVLLTIMILTSLFLFKYPNKKTTPVVHAKGHAPAITKIENENTYPESTPIEIIEAYERKHFDQMRDYLQKIAYGMVGKNVDEQDKQDFKEIVTYFASRDPLYSDLIKMLLPVIAKNEGMLQSTIYPYLSGYSQETVRYVLYFAHELGDIKRIKKGRSYELYTSEINKSIV